MPKKKRVVASTSEEVEEAASEVEEEEVPTLRSGVQSLRGDAVAHSKVGDRLSWADLKDLLDQLLDLPD